MPRNGFKMKMWQNALNILKKNTLIWQYFPLISLVSRLQSWASQIDVSFRPSTCSAVDNKFQLKLDRLFGSRQTKSCLCPFITYEKTFNPINFMQHSPFPDFQRWYLSSQVSFFNNRFFFNRWEFVHSLVAH